MAAHGFDDAVIGITDIRYTDHLLIVYSVSKIIEILEKTCLVMRL
jgi:hypothetical protein